MSLIVVNRTDTFDNWRTKTNQIATNQGDLATISSVLGTPTDLVTAINTIVTDTGDVTTLQTTSKVLVGAVNELLTGTFTFSGTKTFSSGLNIATGTTYKINAADVLTATTLGTSVVNSSLTAVGTIGTGTWQGAIVSPTYGGTGVNNGTRTLTVVTGNVSLTAQAGGSSVTLPSTGTVATLAGTETLTNKTMGLGSNTFNGTLAQFNAACQDADFASLAGTETLTNKTLTSPTINGGTLVLPAATTPAQTTDANAVWDSTNKQLTIGNGTARVTLVNSTRSVATGTGLTGGGDLSTDRTHSLTGQALAIHNLAGTGMISLTAAATFAVRTITAGTGVTVSNGDGVSGNPTIAIGQDVSTGANATFATVTANSVKIGSSANTIGTTAGNLTLAPVGGGTAVTGTLSTSGQATLASASITGAATVGGTLTASGALILPISTTPAQTAQGSAVWDSTNGVLTIGNSTSRVTLVNNSRQVISGTGLSGGGDLSADRTLALTGQALALHNLAATGLVTLTSAGNFSSRTITAGTGISVTNGSGVSGNPTIATVQDIATTATPVFAGVTGNRVRAGVSAAGKIDTTTGDLTIGSSTGNVVLNANVSSLGTVSGSGLLTIQSTGTPGNVMIKVGNSGTTTTWPFTVDDQGNVYVAGNLQVVGTTTSSATNFSVDWPNITSKPSPTITVTATGAMTGTGSFSTVVGTNGTATINLVPADDSITLGTHTVGNYVATVAASVGTELGVTGSGTETAAVTLSIGTDIARRADTHYVGTTAVALNRTSANLDLTGITSVTLPGATSGSVKIIPAAVAGTGTVLTLPAVTGTVITTGDNGTVTNTMLAGSIANAKLANSAVTVTSGTGLSGGGAISLGGSITLTNTDTGSAQNIFKNVAVSGQTTVAAGSNNDTLTLAGTNITITTNAATKTVTLAGNPAANNATITVSAGTGLSGGGSFTTDQSGAATITLTNAGVTSNVAGTGISVSGATGAVSITNSDRGSSQNIFKNIAVGGQTTITAKTNTDTLTVAAGQVSSTNGITLATDNVGNTLTIGHADTSTLSSSSNTAGVVIQSATVDTYGHLTALGTVDLDSRYIQGGQSPSFAAVTTTGDVTVGGNLTVNGTTTTLNTATLDVADLNITVAKNASTSAQADGAGLTVAGAAATFTWNNSESRFKTNTGLNIGGSGQAQSFSVVGSSTNSTLIVSGANNGTFEAYTVGATGTLFGRSKASSTFLYSVGGDLIVGSNGGTIYFGNAAGGSTSCSITSGGFVGNLTGNASGTASNVTGTVAVPNGGTGVTTLTGYIKGNGASAMTAVASIPGSDVSGNISGNAANVTGTVLVGNGGTGATTLTGYVKGNGTAAMTASATIPNTDVTGLGNMSTQSNTSVNIDGGSIDATPIGGVTPAAGSFTNLTSTGATAVKQVDETYSAPAVTTNVVTIDLTQGTVFNVSLTANVTSFTISNAIASKVNTFTVFMAQDATGGRTVSWTFTGKTLKWAGGNVPTVTSGANKTDVFTFVSNDGGATWFGFTGGQNY